MGRKEGDGNVKDKWARETETETDNMRSKVIGF